MVQRVLDLNPEDESFQIFFFSFFLVNIMIRRSMVNQALRYIPLFCCFFLNYFSYIDFRYNNNRVVEYQNKLTEKKKKRKVIVKKIRGAGKLFRNFYFCPKRKKKKKARRRCVLMVKENKNIIFQIYF